MAQEYDKIFKENIEAIILPLAEKLLAIYPERLEEIPDDLQTTIERRPDFLKKVAHAKSELDYILHIEFQTEDEPEMVYRMHEYCAILLRKYKLPLKQFVFFVNQRKAKMKTSLHLDNLSFDFTLTSLQDIDYHVFVNSDKPEEVILAILANFGADQPETVVKTVLEKIKAIPTETLRREKCVKQLEILSNLRNLQALIIKQLEIMALTYDIEKDIRFQQGISKGLQQGISKGISKGAEAKAIEAIAEMLNDNLSPETIAKYLKVSTDFVKNVAETLKK
jgi:predicted transposase/invertase (TIGR01784 family)